MQQAVHQQLSLTLTLSDHLISPAAPWWERICRRGPWVWADPASASPWSKSERDPGRSGSASSSRSGRTGPRRPPSEGARSACGLPACTYIGQKYFKLEFPPQQNTASNTDPLCTLVGQLLTGQMSRSCTVFKDTLLVFFLIGISRGMLCGLHALYPFTRAFIACTILPALCSLAGTICHV